MRTVANHIKTDYNPLLMTEIKQMIIEGVREKAMEDFLINIIKGTEWQGKVFIAGGYVRDEFMGKDPKDLDLLINAPNGGFLFAKWITKKLGIYKGPEVDPPIPPMPQVETDEKGKPTTEEGRLAMEAWEAQINQIQKLYSNPVIFPRFGTVKFNLRGVTHMGIDLSDMDIEAVMPRKEKYVPGSRKPIVTGGELKDDVERRDFTVNSLLKDLSTGEILDLTGMGKADIKAGIVRTPLSPDKIFTDDPLRMLRAVRFAVKYNWQLPMFMLRGLKKNAPQLKNISEERIRDELNKILVTGSPDKGIKMLKITGLMPFVIPELLPLVKLAQNKYHTEDAFKHTLTVLKNTEPDLLVRLMALFHDIGKAVTRTVDPKTGGIHFYGHDMAGERIVEEVMSRLKYPRELIDAVKMGVRHHMRLKQSGATGVEMKEKTLMRFRDEMGQYLQQILKLMHADNMAHADPERMRHQIAGIEARLKGMEDVPVVKKTPISGADLIAMELKPGPLFKEIMAEVLEACYASRWKLTKEEALEIARRMAQSAKAKGQI